MSVLNTIFHATRRAGKNDTADLTQAVEIMARHPPPRGRLKRAFHEVKHNEPKIVAKTRRKKGAKAARRQKISIALSKARR